MDPAGYVTFLELCCCPSSRYLQKYYNFLSPDTSNMQRILRFASICNIVTNVDCAPRDAQSKFDTFGPTSPSRGSIEPVLAGWQARRDGSKLDARPAFSRLSPDVWTNLEYILEWMFGGDARV